jgi:hypothetical protein
MKYVMIRRGSCVRKRLARYRAQGPACPLVQGKQRTTVRRHRPLSGITCQGWDGPTPNPSPSGMERGA